MSPSTARHTIADLCPGGENRDLAGLEDGGDPHRDRLARDGRLAEEPARRVTPRDPVEQDTPGATLEPRSGLVETDMPRLADPQELKVDPPGGLDGRLIGLAVGGYGLRWDRPIEQVHLGRWNVDLRE
jgi:hypothetical protein